MLSEKDVLALQERQKDLLREAERERMARRALAGGGQIGLYPRALAWLAFFMARGRFIQRRYAFGVLPGNGTASLNSASTQDCGCV